MKISLIIFDTLRKDHTGKTYGNSWIKTPNFDKFAKDSIVFDKAYPESLPTIPVRRAIHTGIRTFPFNHMRPALRTDDIVKTLGWDPIPPHQTHLAEYLKKDIYITSFITSTYHQFKPNMNFHIGFDQWNWIRGHEGDKFRVIFREGRSKLKQLLKEHSVKELAGRAYQRRVLKTHFSNVQGRKEEKDYHIKTNKAVFDLLWYGDIIHRKEGWKGEVISFLKREAYHGNHYLFNLFGALKWFVYYMELTLELLKKLYKKIIGNVKT